MLNVTLSSKQHHSQCNVIPNTTASLMQHVPLCNTILHLLNAIVSWITTFAMPHHLQSQPLPMSIQHHHECNTSNTFLNATPPQSPTILSSRLYWMTHLQQCNSLLHLLNATPPWMQHHSQWNAIVTPHATNVITTLAPMQHHPRCKTITLSTIMFYWDWASRDIELAIALRTMFRSGGWGWQHHPQCNTILKPIQWSMQPHPRMVSH